MNFNTRDQHQALIPTVAGFLRDEPGRMPNRPLLGLILAVLFFGGCTAAAFYLSSDSASEDPGSVVRTFLQSTSDGDYERAYSFLSSSWRSRSGVEEFEAEFRSKAEFSDIIDFRASRQERPASRTGLQYAGRLTYEDNQIGSLSATLTYEPDGWKISSIEARR